MAYIAIQNFKYGLDTRRLEETTQPGALTTLRNAHINQGGEIQKRMAFERLALPAGTFGMQVTSAGIAVFGSQDLAGETYPDNVYYVRCQHPDNASAEMTAVIASTCFNGEPVAICDFGVDGIITFKGSTVIDDLSPGRLASIYADGTALAAYFAEVINAADDGFTATSTGPTLTVTADVGTSFHVDESNDSVCTSEPSPPSVAGLDVSTVSVHVTWTGLSYDVDLYIGSDATPDADYTNDGSTAHVIITSPATSYGPTTIANATLGNPKGGWEFAVRMGAGSGGNLDGGSTVNGTITVTYSNGAVGIFTFDETDLATITTAKYFTLVATEPMPATITPSTVSDGTIPIAGVAPQGQFEIVAVKSGASGKMTSVLIGAQEVLGTAGTALSGANYATTEELAEAVKDQINLYCTGNNLDFIASRIKTVVFIRATDPATYETWEGKPITVVVDGDICIGRYSTSFAQEPGSATIPTVSFVNVNGANIMTAATIGPPGSTTLDDLASDLAADIQTSMADGYCAVPIERSVFISKLTTSSNDLSKDVNIGVANGTGNENSGGGGGSTALQATPEYTNGSGVKTTEYKWQRGTGLNSTHYACQITCNVVGGVPPYSFVWDYGKYRVQNNAFIPFDSRVITVVGSDNARTFQGVYTSAAQVPECKDILVTVTDAAGTVVVAPAASIKGVTQ